MKRRCEDIPICAEVQVWEGLGLWYLILILIPHPHRYRLLIDLILNRMLAYMVISLRAETHLNLNSLSGCEFDLF